MMAGCSRSDPTGLAQMWLTLALSILQVIPTHLDKAEAQTQDIVQNELMQLMEEVAIKNEYASKGFHIETEKDHLGLPTEVRITPIKRWQGELNFDPPYLDFGEVPIGMPQIAMVKVFNPQQQSALRMVSISGTTPHFHCSFFQEKTIPAGGNTTFEIVFLPRLPGNVENTIFIHSNKGSAPYQVFGTGVPNPYRLRPILGARVPLNTSFSPLINMHNPYSSGLMITEMYSSGGDLHLELPTGSQEAPQNLWEIPPYQTRSVMRASFTGREESNHTAFIRIKTNYTSNRGYEGGDFLMLPVEVEVSAAPGLYSSLEMIDFGTLRSLDEPKTIQLYLLNTNPKIVQITSVALVRTNQAISIDFKPVELSASSQKHRNVANITFHPLKANYSRFWSGKIIVKTKDKNLKLQIPYQAHVLPGTLSVNKTSTVFQLLDPPHRQPEERKLFLTNFFNFSIVIHQAQLVNNALGTFEIKNFSSPIIIPPHETDSSLSLSFTPSDSLTSLSTVLRLGTNASLFTIPVHAYTGKLKFFMYGKEIPAEINLGSASLSEHRAIIVIAVNDNPVDVPLTYLDCTLPNCDLVIILVKEGNTTYLGDEFDPRDWPVIRYSRLIVPAHHYALMALRYTTPKNEGTFDGIVTMETDYHIYTHDARVKAVEGFLTIKPEKVVFPPSYPGLVQTQSITVLNSFSHKMVVDSLKAQPPDEQFFFRPPKKTTNLEVEASKKTKIGKIVFDSRKRCHPDCYVGLPTTTQDGQMWLNSLKSDDNQEVDKLFFNFRRNKWVELQEAGLAHVNGTMKLTTSLVRDLTIPVSAELKWPQLSAKEMVKFPMTLVDSGAKSTMTLVNPTESTILIQLVPITAYNDPHEMLELFSDRFDPEMINVDDPNPFSVKDVGKKDCRGDCVKAHLAAIEETYGIKPDPSHCAMALRPRQNATVHLSFRPYDNKGRISLFVIRNNLSVIDGFLVQGMGAKAELKLNSKLPGPNSNIVFDMKAQHLNDCDRSSPKARTPPHFTVKRSLTLKNTGQIPLHILSWYINGQRCEGYGFRVLQCEPMFVQPNTTTRLDITFCPDFSMARVVRTLQIQMGNKELVEYSLIASLPHHLLATCAAVVPRPTFEYAMYSVCVGLMSFFFVVIFTVAYLEAVRFMEPLPIKIEPDPTKPDPLTLKKFDLRTIGVTKTDDPGGTGGKPRVAGYGDSGGGATRNQKSSVNQGNKSLRQRTPALNNNKQLDSRNTELKTALPREKMRINDLHSNSTSNNRSGGRRAPSSNNETAANQEQRPLTHHRSSKKRPAAEETDTTERRDLLDVQPSPSEMQTEETKGSPGEERGHRGRRRGGKHEQRRQQQQPLAAANWKSALDTAQNDEEDNDENEQKETMESDELSSTTTESSTADSEQAAKPQFMNQLDDFAPLATSKPRPSSKSVTAEQTPDHREGDSTFEDVKSRSRWKNVQKSVDKPSSLELPYTTSLEAGRKRYHPASLHPSTKEPISPHTLAAKAAAKATRNIKLKTKTSDSSDTTSTTSTASSERDKDSPPPLWELPRPVPTHYHQHPVAYTNKSPSSGQAPADTNLFMTESEAAKKAKADKLDSYSSVVSGKTAEVKKPRLNKTNSAPSGKNSAFSAVHAVGGGKGQSRPKQWKNGREFDSASDTSSGTSSSPTNSGLFHTPKGRAKGTLKGPARLKAPTGLPPYGYSDDLGMAPWDQKAEALPFTPASSASVFPATSGAGMTLRGDDWNSFGMNKAPGSGNSLWNSPPGFPTAPGMPPSSAHMTPGVLSAPPTWSTDSSPPGRQPTNFFSTPRKSPSVGSLWDRGAAPTSPLGPQHGQPPLPIPMPTSSAGSTWNNSGSDLFPVMWNSSGNSSGGLGLSTQENEEPARSFGLFSNSIWSNRSSDGWSLWPRDGNNEF